MTVSNLEKSIISHVAKQHRPHIILFIGSRASGKASKTSDWDIFCIGNYPKRDSRVESFKGENLDIVLVPSSNIKKAKCVIGHHYGPFKFVRYAWTKNKSYQGLAEKIITATAKAYLDGPPPLNRARRTEIRSELTRKIKKMSAHIHDPFTVADQKAFFILYALEDWCLLNGIWPLPPIDGFQVIKLLDKELFEKFVRLSKSNTNKKTLNISKEICADILSKL